MITLEIQDAKCDNCNLCLAACPFGGLSIIEGRIVPVKSLDCGDCRICEYICDRGAIRWNYQVVIYASSTD